jgi:hypothetical protein
MPSQTRHRIAALLAFIIGLMTIVEGGSVLLGIETKTYPVLQWLLIYNVVLGFVSLIAGISLWMQRLRGIMLARTILVCHGAVFISLGGMYLLGKTVAVTSIMAMLFRTGIWLVINFMIREKGQDMAGLA